MLYTSLTLILNYLTVMIVITLSLDRVEPVTSGSDAKANSPPQCSYNGIFLSSEYYITVCVWQFLCLKNIRVFLQTCRTVFQMPDDHLFEPNDLFDIKDFGKVCTHEQVYGSVVRPNRKPRFFCKTYWNRPTGNILKP